MDSVDIHRDIPCLLNGLPANMVDNAADLIDLDLTTAVYFEEYLPVRDTDPFLFATVLLMIFTTHVPFASADAVRCGAHEVVNSYD